MVYIEIPIIYYSHVQYDSKHDQYSYLCVKHSLNYKVIFLKIVESSTIY